MMGQSEQLQPDEEFIPWDLIAMTVLAEKGVNKMVEWMQQSRRWRLWVDP